MIRIVCLLGAIACTNAKVTHLADRDIDLFKYNPNDVYTLPIDVDDDKPAVVFSGDVQKAKVEHYENFNGNKKFKLELKTQNGIEVSQVGKLKDEKTFIVSGSYSFTGADGKRYKTRYTADEFGYHPKTELDLDIPEPQFQNIGPQKNVINEENGGKNGIGNNKNRFQFLNQNLNLELNQSPERGISQIGDDYSYAFQNNNDHSENGYNYSPPKNQFETPKTPSREYLPVR